MWDRSQRSSHDLVDICIYPICIYRYNFHLSASTNTKLFIYWQHLIWITRWQLNASSRILIIIVNVCILYSVCVDRFGIYSMGALSKFDAPSRNLHAAHPNGPKKIKCAVRGLKINLSMWWSTRIAHWRVMRTLRWLTDCELCTQTHTHTHRHSTDTWVQ